MKSNTPKLDKLTWSNINRHLSRLRKAAKQAEQNGMTYRQFLTTLSNDDLGITITALTIRFGRSLEDSVRNARCHLEDRDNAIRCFTTKDPEADFGAVA